MAPSARSSSTTIPVWSGSIRAGSRQCGCSSPKAFATSIVYMALENIVAPGLGRRWLIAFGFGLVHGFGFSFALRDTMQLAGSHLLISLLSFNVGVELGQVAVLAVLIPALALLFRFVV